MTGFRPSLPGFASFCLPSRFFGLDPLEAETFWKLTPSMIERARRYGILGEIRELARWLGLKMIEMENPGTKFYPIELVKTLGANRKAPVKVGDQVPKWEGSEETTKVKAILKDFLNNETWITEFTYERHIFKTLTKKKIPLRIDLSEIQNFLKNPEKVYRDKVNGAFLFARKIGGKWLALVVGEDSRKIFTIMPIKATLSKEKYELLFEGPK